MLSAAPANILLYPDSIVSGSGTVMQTRSSLPDGNFGFDGVLPGAYNLLVSIAEGVHTSAWAQRLVLVGPAGADGLVISPNSTVSLTARIRVDGGGDLSKMRVALLPLYSSGTRYSPPVRTDGTFNIEHLPPGKYRVQFAGTPAGYYLKVLRCGDQDVSGHIVDLSAGGPAELEALLSLKAGSVSGIVVFRESDSPASEMRVVLIPQEKERRLDLSAYPTAITDESGKFAIRDVVPGEYRAFAWESMADNVFMDPDFVRPLESRGVAVSLAESGQANIKLTLRLQTIRVSCGGVSTWRLPDRCQSSDS